MLKPGQYFQLAEICLWRSFQKRKNNYITPIYPPFYLKAGFANSTVNGANRYRPGPGRKKIGNQ